MKFSLFYEMQMAYPAPNREKAIFHESVTQAKLADELGYHCIWAVEHHGLYQYSHCSAPESFLAFLAAVTKRIRLGHGCTLLPHRYNHPIRIAERIATLDILSEGRVNWGSARSGSRVELEAFEVDTTTVRDQWLEALQMIPRMWASDIYAHQGIFFNIPPTCVVPKPVQKPHPPMFAACSRPSDAAAVGRLGIGALNLAMHREEFLAEKVREYREAVAAAEPIGFAVNNHFACNPSTLVLKDDLKACQHGLRGAMYFTESMMHYYGAERPVGSTNIPDDFLPDRHVEQFRKTRNTPRAQLSTVIGDPAAARESVQRFVDAGVDELILVMQTGTAEPEMIMESIKTFGECVMPHFA